MSLNHISLYIRKSLKHINLVNIINLEYADKLLACENMHAIFAMVWFLIILKFWLLKRLAKLASYY